MNWQGQAVDNVGTREVVFSSEIQNVLCSFLETCPCRGEDYLYYLEGPSSEVPLSLFFQLEITALSYGKGPRISAGMGDVTDTNLPPPTEEDQEKMRKFWAMEEANSPRGWEDEQELDYAEISQRTADQSQNSGPPPVNDTWPL